MNMLFFRSEEALNDWLLSRNVAKGAVFSIPELWKLSRRWYAGRMSLEYHSRTMEQVHEIFKENGLTSSFWRV
jgi:hypothetical protein